MIDFSVTKEVFVIMHLFGVVIGAGGALMADAMFVSSVRDRKFSKTEVRFLKLASGMVWMGIAVLLLSGIGIVASDPAGYLSSSKFLAKMTIIGIIVLNGLAFHFLHFPLIRRHTGMNFSESDEFMKKCGWVMASGAVSFVSWSSAVLLGALRQPPWSYVQIMGTYLVVLAIAITIAILFKDCILLRASRRRGFLSKFWR